jgi:hypothetical protein
LRDGDVLKAVQTRVAAFLTNRNRAG